MPIAIYEIIGSPLLFLLSMYRAANLQLVLLKLYIVSVINCDKKLKSKHGDLCEVWMGGGGQKGKEEFAG